MTRAIKIVGVLSLLLWSYGTSHASEAITLSCDGTITMGNANGEPIQKVGVVVNPTARTVSFNGYAVPITQIDDAVVQFDGATKSTTSGISITIHVSGSVDRVTGAVTATTATGSMLTQWELYCKPATRMF